MPSETPATTTGSQHDSAQANGQVSLQGTWRVSSQRSRIGFRVKKMGIYYVKGRFREIEGTVQFGPPSASGEVLIEASSVTTRMPPRDVHLRSGDFLGVDRYPEIRVSAASIESGADGALRVPGTFELHGERGTVTLTGHAHEGTDSVVVHLAGTLDRHAFEIHPRQPFEMIVGREVLLDVELVLEPA